MTCDRCQNHGETPPCPNCNRSSLPVGDLFVLEPYPGAKELGPLPPRGEVVGPGILNPKGIGLALTVSKGITAKEIRQGMAFMRAAIDNLRLAEHHVSANENMAFSLRMKREKLEENYMLIEAHERLVAGAENPKS